MDKDNEIFGLLSFIETNFLFYYSFARLTHLSKYSFQKLKKITQIENVYSKYIWFLNEEISRMIKLVQKHLLNWVFKES